MQNSINILRSKGIFFDPHSILTLSNVNNYEITYLPVNLMSFNFFHLLLRFQSRYFQFGWQ